MPRRWVARLAALVIACAGAVPSHAEPLIDLSGAVAVAGQQTRALFARLGDLHKSHADGNANGGFRTERLKLTVDDKPVPLRAFSRFVPRTLRRSETGRVGSFFSGAGTLTSRGNSRLRLETKGLTAGTDLRITPRTTVGVAAGYFNTGGQLSGGSMAVYGAQALGGGLMIDALAGTGELHGGADMSFAGASARWDWQPAERLRVGASSRFSFAAADSERMRTDTGLLTALFGLSGSYRLKTSWGSLMPHAGVEHFHQTTTGAGTAMPVPATTSLRFGFTAAHDRGAIVTLDHMTEMGRWPGGNHAVRAGLKLRF